MGYIARKRLEARRIVVIDATNLYREHRAVFANLARQQNAPLTAITFELSENACQTQNATRTDGEPRPRHVVRRHWQTLKRTLKTLPKEGFRRRFRIRTPEDGGDAEIRLEPLVCDRRSDTRPVDIIGDVHGCRQELEDLLAKLGYRIESEAADDGGTRYRVTPPGTRRAVLLGDLVDRGPDSPGTLELVMDMVESGAAIAVQGNHDNKLMRALTGRDVQRSHGLAETMEALEKRPEAESASGRSSSRWRATSCSTAGTSWPPTPGWRSTCRTGRAATFASSASTATATARPTRTASPSAETGAGSTAVRPRSCTGTPPRRGPSGSTTPSASTPGASGADP